MVVVPHVSIFPDKLCCWNSFEDIRKKDRNIFGLRENNPNAALSQKGSKSLRTAIAWLCHLAKLQEVNDGRLSRKFKFTLNFITLSLPSPQIKYYQLPCGKLFYGPDFKKFFPAYNLGFGKLKYFYDDKWIKSNLLNQFLTELRQKFKAVNYVWKAETQANGNIHFHITLNRYIYQGDLRVMWNRILDKTDFVTRYSQKFSHMSFEQYYEYRNSLQSVSYKRCLKAWEKGTLENWQNPNSTDVHSVRQIRDIGAYLSKYFIKKNEKRRFVEGFLWRLSYQLSKFKSACTAYGSRIDSELSYLKRIFPKKIREYDWSQIYYIKIKDVFALIPNSLLVKTFSDYVFKVLHPDQLAVAPVPAAVSSAAVISMSVPIMSKFHDLFINYID
jgi:hypothetical protein